MKAFFVVSRAAVESASVCRAFSQLPGMVSFCDCFRVPPQGENYLDDRAQGLAYVDSSLLWQADACRDKAQRETFVDFRAANGMVADPAQYFKFLAECAGQMQAQSFCVQLLLSDFHLWESADLQRAVAESGYPILWVRRKRAISEAISSLVFRAYIQQRGLYQLELPAEQLADEMQRIVVERLKWEAIFAGWPSEVLTCELERLQQPASSSEKNSSERSEELLARIFALSGLPEQSRMEFERDFDCQLPTCIESSLRNLDSLGLHISGAS